jgi:hypothetical protein
MQNAKRYFYITIFYYYYFCIFCKAMFDKKKLFFEIKKLPRIDLRGFLKHTIKPKNQKNETK